MKNIEDTTYMEHLETVDALEQEIKPWYMETYPTDDLGAELPEGETFGDALKVLTNGENFYLFLGVGDSVIRERIFEKLANIIGASYGEIYDMWLRGA